MCLGAASGVTLRETGHEALVDLPTALALLKRLAIVLLGLAFLGGTVAPGLSASAERCPMSMSPRGDMTAPGPCGGAAGTPCTAPCGSTLDCALAMSCSAILTMAIADRLLLPAPREAGRLAYAETSGHLVGLAISPPLSPPIAAA